MFITRIWISPGNQFNLQAGEHSDYARGPRVGRACSAEANRGREMLFSSSGDLGKIGRITTPGNRI